jgi:hypothetical protein
MHIDDEPIEYEIGPETWRVEEPVQLFRDFGIVPAQVVAFHRFASPHQLLWRGIRLVYGINPIDGVDEPYLDKMTLEEAGLSLKEDLGAAFEVLAMDWRRRSGPRVKPLPHVIEPPKSEPEPVKQVPPIEKLSSDSPAISPVKKGRPRKVEPEPRTEWVKSTNRMEMVLDDEGKRHAAIVQAFGFDPYLVNLGDREAWQNVAELVWLSGRLEELRTVFEEPMAKTLARQAIQCEIQMRRCDDKLMTLAPDAETFWDLQETKIKIEEMYLKHWEAIEAACPTAKANEKRVKFTHTFTDIVRAYREYKENEKNELVDGLLTVYGIQVENFVSAQDPACKYRPGLVAAVNEAKLGINDPNWRRRIPIGVLKIMDAGYAEAQRKLVESGTIRIVNLEAEGPSGEYPDLDFNEVAEIEPEITPPEESVALE